MRETDAWQEIVASRPDEAHEPENTLSGEDEVPDWLDSMESSMELIVDTQNMLISG